MIHALFIKIRTVKSNTMSGALSELAKAVSVLFMVQGAVFIT